MAAPGRQALQDIDQVLAARPVKDDHALSRATLDLCTFRETLIARAAGPDAAPEAAQRLATLNGIISVVAATHFPTGSIPWEELERVRPPLAELLSHEDEAKA